MRRILLACLLLSLALLVACAPEAAPPTAPTTPPTTTTPTPDSSTTGTTPSPVTSPTPVPSELKVHFIDVGQGDSILIDFGEREILIDGGDRSPSVVTYLKAYVDGPIEAMFATHPHADHIGGLIAVLASFKVDSIWLNGDASTSQTYGEFTSAVNAEGAEVHVARRGDQIKTGDLILDVLNPTEPPAGSTNNKSIFLLLSHSDTDFLFTGDAETEAEASMLSAHLIPDVEILKVGHHGSRTASSKTFLQAAKPEVAIYMAGEGNSYRHPHPETIAALADVGAEIYGTDLHGTIVVTTDGKSFSVKLEKQVAPRAPPVSVPEPAKFVVSNLSISPGEVKAGESVTISVDVVNSGDTSGTHTISLKVNGSELTTKNLTLDPGQSQTVTFTTQTQASGTYTIEVDSLRGTFKVNERVTQGILAVSSSVKFPSLGGGTQTLYATVTMDGQPVQGAEVSITVYYKTVTRAFTAASPTGLDGKTQLSWSVGRPRGGYTVRIEVVATYQGQRATTTTGFYAP